MYWSPNSNSDLLLVYRETKSKMSTSPVLFFKLHTGSNRDVKLSLGVGGLHYYLIHLLPDKPGSD